ncbi:SIR2 family protein, partial [Porphyromonas cangingivalis]
MSEKTTLEITEISDKNLIRMLIDKQKSNGNMKFCFLIGSGASRSSGIATGGTLAGVWYKEIESDTEKAKFEQWKKKEGIDEKDLAASYSAIYKERFQNCPESGYEALIKIMEGKNPSIGYIILAKIIVDEGHNVVITTNFDNLLEDAIRTYTEKKPFIAGHERLADYVPKRSDRPIIVKVHRDLYLQPKSDTEETSELSEQWKSVLDDILSNYYLIVIGYGGNDGSLMKYLEAKKDERKGNFRRKNIYWCLMEGEAIPEKIRKVLDQEDRIVRIKGFDELMYQCYIRLGFDFLDEIEKIDPTPPHKLLAPSYERIASLQKQKKELAEKLEKREKEEESNQISDSDTLIYLFRIGIENDLDKKDALFKEALQKYPNDLELLSQYANFLTDIRKEHDKAEEYYKKAIEIDEKDPDNLGNYAIFLEDIRKDYDKAEQYYKKA